MINYVLRTHQAPVAGVQGVVGHGEGAFLPLNSFCPSSLTTPQVASSAEYVGEGCIDHRMLSGLLFALLSSHGGWFYLEGDPTMFSRQSFFLR